jgi:hypothetical protein
MHIRLLIYYIDRRSPNVTMLLQPGCKCIVWYHKPYNTTAMRARIEPLAEMWRTGRTWQDLLTACIPKAFARIGVEFLISHDHINAALQEQSE